MEMKQNELVKQELHDEEFNFEDFDFDSMEDLLNQDIENLSTDLEFLVEEKEKIGSPENLGKVIKDVIWEQFQNQIAVTAGEDFIKENNGLHLDLRKEAHIQTTENFAKGKIATHNTGIDYQKRYDDWQSNFMKDENGNIVTHKTRTGKEEATLVKGARKLFDKGRPKGSVERHTDMDHTISAAEIIRDPAANAHLTKDEQIAFANSDKNLNEMPSNWNRSKGDSAMNDWLDNSNANGQKPDEIFDMSPDDKAKLRQKDIEAREEKERQIKEGERKSVEAGKKSQKEEVFRIGKSALRAVVMQLLTELIKEIIAKLVKWFKSTKKVLSTLVDSLKEAIHSFIGNLQQNFINAGNTLFTTIATAIVGPIIGTLKKAWMMLKQGWSSLKNAIQYIKDPTNKDKPMGILMMEAGKIIISGMTGVGALLLGEVVEKGLMSISGFAVEIPLLGSLANILGMFFGAVVAGIIGAIAINFIEKRIEKSLKRENLNQTIEKQSEILQKQKVQIALAEKKLDYTKEKIFDEIDARHREANDVTREILDEIFTPVAKTEYDLDEMQADLESLL